MREVWGTERLLHPTVPKIKDERNRGMSEEVKKNAEETAEETKCEESCKETKKKSTEKKSAEKEKKLKAEIEELKGKLLDKEKELDDLNERHIRILAEYENYRRRTTKEKEEIHTDAYFDAIGEILPIIDNIERAAEYKDAEKVAEGIQMILRSFNDMLEKNSINAYGEVGDEFNPNIHDAMMHIESEDFGENVISAVYQKGYKKEERVLRHAKVVVAN